MTNNTNKTRTDALSIRYDLNQLADAALLAYWNPEDTYHATKFYEQAEKLHKALGEMLKTKG